MQVLNPFFLNHSETWMAASFSLTFAFSSIWHCIIHCRSKSLLIPTSAGGNFWIPSKRMPTKHCFWAIRYSSFQSASFKEEGISDSELMQNLRNSKNIFCCFNIKKLYFCTHEREISKRRQQYFADALEYILLLPSHFKVSIISFKQGLAGMLPAQLVDDTISTIFTHLLTLLRIIKQFQNLLCHIFCIISLSIK